MPTLDDDLITLSKLSDYRKRATKLRTDGRQAINRITSQASAKLAGWRTSDDEVETALLALVQRGDVAKRRENTEASKIVERLRELTLEDLFGLKGKGPSVKEELSTVPVLIASSAMHALTATSKYAFSKTTLLCYYRIVREIYSADSPDWSTGGAKAGNGGESTAFMTGECVRAVSSFVRTHKHTSSFFKRTFEMYRRREHLSKLDEAGKWRDAEIERAGLAWYNSTNAQLGEIALDLPPREEPTKKIDSEYIDKYLNVLRRSLVGCIRSSRQNFKDALREITQFRKDEELSASTQTEQRREHAKRPRRGKDQRFIRSESAHRMALRAVEQAIERADDALNICQAEDEILDSLQQLAELFSIISCDIEKILEPARRFLGASLDRELTAASATSQPAWDARELVFAAASFSAVTGWQHDERLTRACDLLCDAISERGLFPPGRPFHSTANGFSLYASSFEVARSFAQLLHRTEFSVTPQLIGRMLRLFEDNGITLKASGVVNEGCWHAEAPPIPKRPTLWVTAIAVLALDRIVRMLDHKINEGVFKHFSTIRFDGKDASGLRLEELSFSDYHLCAVPDDVKLNLPPEQQRKWSIAVTLEQMRAHVTGTTLPKPYSPPIFAGVLFGPPGTGKTTLLEAVARSSSLPLVQVTPSDIALAGEQAIEKSAKMIFDALSMLTKAIIIFDEFEPILLDREANGNHEERSIFTFLTPGMLPKLKKLYGAAEEQQLAYCLVTNHYGKLDKAAIRRGRFDEHIAIYHPDFLSRAGMFIDRLYQHEGVTRLTATQKKRFEDVIKWTVDVNMQDLAKDHFRVPKKKEELKAKSFAAYVLNNSKEVHAGKVKPTSDPQEALTLFEKWLSEGEEKMAYVSLWNLLKE